MRKSNVASRLLTASILCAALGANAVQAPQYRFDIPAQRLRDALEAYSLQADQQIVFSEELVGGRTSPELKGEFSVDEALSKMLAGSGLVASRTISGVLVLQQAPNETTSTTAVNKWNAALSRSSGGAASTAGEEPILEEVIVTAERRTTDMQKTATSITVLNGGELQKQGRVSLQQTLEDVPGLTAGVSSDVYVRIGSPMAGSVVSIRGVAANAAPQGSITLQVPTTALYTDGVYEGIGGRYDIDRVEVLRGPQGTLYGRSATAGVIATHTRNPELGDFGANLSAKLGDYSLQHYTAAVNLPAGDTLAFRIAANHYQRDGYYNGKGGALETTEGRVKMLYKPIEALSILIGAAFEEDTTHSGGATGVITAPEQFTWVPASVFSGKNRSRQYWANVDWDLGAATLTYQPALRTWTQDATVYSIGPGGSPLVSPNHTPTADYATHELRLASNGDTQLKWLVGAFHYDNKLVRSKVVNWYTSNALVYSVDARKDTRDLGIFSEATYSLTDALRITAGLRYDETDVETSETYTSNLNQLLGAGASKGLPVVTATRTISGSEGSRKFYNLTYKGRIEYDVAPSSMIYGAVSSGFLPGDVQIATISNGQPAPVPYDEETLMAFELGSKNRFLDQRLQVNGSVYYYRYGGYQVTVIPDLQNPGTQVLVSVPVRMKGGELEVEYLLTAVDRLNLSYSYTDSYFVDPPATFSAAVAQSKLWNVVPHSATASYSHVFQLSGESTFTARAAARYLAEHDVINISPSLNAQGGGAYIRASDAVIGDLYGTWNSAGRKFAVTGYVRNVGDKRYLTSVILQSVNPLSVTGLQSDPRTYGVVLSANF